MKKHVCEVCGTPLEVEANPRMAAVAEGGEVEHLVRCPGCGDWGPFCVTPAGGSPPED